MEEERVKSLENLIKKISVDIADHRNDFKTSFDKLEQRIESISFQVHEQERLLTNNNARIETNIVDINSNKFEIGNVVVQINKLKKDNDDLNKKLDEQIDRNMRETLIFDGIKGGDERAWANTKHQLATTLTRLENKYVREEDERYTYDDFYSYIVRAHRGTKGKKDDNKIYAKFNASDIVDHIKELSFTERNIFINQMRSPMINKRLYEGRQEIKILKQTPESQSWRMHMNDRCQLMVKKAGDQRYSLHKQF